MRNLRPILLVEDDLVDAMTVKRAVEELKVVNPLITRINGEEALEYLNNGDNKKPCVILLDLNMPKMGGIEFLRIARADDNLKRIPVIVLTTSREDSDKTESFNLGVAGYIIKSIDYRKFVEAVKIIDLYWSLSELPNG
jgi:CheY-like chemotaxis protein